MPVTFFSRLPQIVAELHTQGKIKEALLDGGETIADAARERVPVESGDLRDAIHVEETEGGVSVVAGDSDVFYGHMVEFGTTHSSARPFMVPAFEAEAEAVLDEVRDALDSL